MAKDSFSQFRQAAAVRLRHAETRAERKAMAASAKPPTGPLEVPPAAPIGRYIVDFVSPEARLVIEVDGATHSEPEEVARDAARTAELEEHGYRVIRVWNSDVYDNPDGVLELILTALP